jgi:hypothetical protein
MTDFRFGTPGLFDIEAVEALLIQCARQRRDISYSEALLVFGMRFSRPKMRALCVVLSHIDARAEARGEPELAVLVVRETDRIPGQGWWIGRSRYKGPREGAEAAAYIRRVQQKAWRYWRKRPLET